MSRDAEYQPKMDAIDLLISVLKDHEKNLDSLISRLSDIIEERKEKPRKGEERAFVAVECEGWQDFKEKGRSSKLASFHLEAGSLIIEALSERYLLRYSEEIPRLRFHVKKEREGYTVEGYAKGVKTAELEGIISMFRGELKCGLSLGVKGSRVDVKEDEFVINVSYELNKEKIKDWLSWELNVPKENVVLGKALH